MGVRVLTSSERWMASISMHAGAGTLLTCLAPGGLLQQVGGDYVITLVTFHIRHGAPVADEDEVDA